VIRSIRHKGLKRLFEDDDPRGVTSQHASKLRDVLARLDAAGAVADMDLPGFRLHSLKGDFRGFGQSQFAQIGESFSGLRTGKR
jgi:toxin HigB-1